MPGRMGATVWHMDRGHCIKVEAYAVRRDDAVAKVTTQASRTRGVGTLDGQERLSDCPATFRRLIPGGRDCPGGEQEERDRHAHCNWILHVLVRS
jgi:hypothetical protein